ncbi:PP2C family protein-serine/threonine phosphatase [bacterium]|nr:PP2C family protein-serine/threonine phosphatase [bacterium]
MNIDKQRMQWIGLGIVAILGIAAFFQLLDRFYPAKAANIQLSRKQAITIAEEFLTDQFLSVDDYQCSVNLQYNNEAFLYLQKAYGLAAAQDWMRYRRHSGVEFSWFINYYQDLPRSAEQHRLFVGISGSGYLSGFIHVLPVDMSWPRPESARLSQEEAFRIALDFISAREVDLVDFMDVQYSANTLKSRVDHNFSWNYDAGPTGCTVNLRIRISGDIVTLYQFDFEIPRDASITIKRQSGNEYFLDTVVSIFVLFLTGLLTLFIFLKKYHEGEVEVRSGGIVFMVIWCSFIIQALLRFQINATGTNLGELSQNGVALFIFILFVLIIRPLLSLFGFTAWSVGEALGRERFADKFRSLDALLNKRVFTLNFAISTLQGYLGGAILIGLLAVLYTLSIEKFGAVISISGFQTLLPSPLPSLLPVLIALWAALMGEMIYRLFANLWIFQRWGRKSISIIVSAVFWSFYVPGFWDLHVGLYPLINQLLIAFIVGAFLSIFFWRFDLLTVIFCNFITIGVFHTLPLLTAESSQLKMGGWMSLALLMSPLIIMIMGFIRKERFVLKVDRMPAHIRRITDRVRMSKELEIARQVQMRLLPKESPDIAGFEIKGGCVPAQEVGGDYFDFIELGADKLGIVIGDVSGKGVPAAIYMTLTKGIVQSHQDGLSPKEVMIRVNNMLYKAMDRETFVSLFYAILNTKKRILTYARAGHNPLIYYNSKERVCQMLEPDGIALGLEAGERFNRVIEEKHLKLRDDDVLAFYTDGFTEAMNLQRDEYGEDRLAELIATHHDKDVRSLYTLVLKDVRQFVGNAPQHDDMTLIFVKGKSK